MSSATENTYSVKDFFESVHPGVFEKVHSLSEDVAGAFNYITWPTLELFCANDKCNGIRFFDSLNKKFDLDIGIDIEQFVTFRCRNCKETYKSYAIKIRIKNSNGDGELFKYGEHPTFGSPTPAKLITLFGSERDYYLKGRRAENQGLGIAAFAYYRRVVEHQKARIFDEIIRVSKQLKASQNILDELEAAKSETQFSSAISKMKHGIPDGLLINGHNPLTLLHSALSEGIHAQTDEECLEIATSIRIVLTEMVEKIKNAVSDEAQLNKAVSRLLTKKPPN